MVQYHLVGWLSALPDEEERSPLPLAGKDMRLPSFGLDDARPPMSVCYEMRLGSPQGAHDYILQGARYR